MIDIKELRALRGPNRHTRHTAIFMVLDINEYESRPSDKIKGFSDRLLTLIPTLQSHGCSIGKPGGFIQRLQNGTWAGHIIEHIAIELQCLAGMEVGYGKSLSTPQKGTYIIVFRYLVESAGLKAAKDAVSLFEAVAEGKEFDVNKIVSDLKVLREEDMLGPTTWSIVKEAKSRGIPFIRLNQDSHIQLGYGAGQKRIQASITSNTSAIAVETADEKTAVKVYLKKAGIPVPNGRVVTTQDEAMDAFNEIGTAVVVKPDVGNHGNGSTINITNPDQLKKAFQAAKAYHPDVIVEEYVHGGDYRLLVIDGKFIAAARREPAHIIGDGKSSINDLIKQVNSDPLRGFGHEKVLTQIEVDEMTERLLSLNGLSINSVPQEKQIVYLKATANLSQGGTATDVTDEVNPDIRLMAERAARIIGLDCVGIDALAEDISQPLGPSGIKVVEVNAAPGFRMHLEPTKGRPRNVAKPIVDMLFPEGYIQVPVLAVTGTNGKTTTCKLIAHTLKYSGKKVGLTCTTGIAIDGNSILTGDYSGPEGAGIVVREPTVDHIVLEIARGGIVRRGLGVDEVDVGVLLNIGEDHLGTDWIESQDELCMVKSTVVEVVKKTGTSVLNADDNASMSVLERARGNIILFSLDPENPKIKKHIREGGTVIILDGRNAVIRTMVLDIIVCTLEEIPITFGGIIDFNTANALAAIGALHGLGLTLEQIRNGIMTFYPSANQNPGRMNLFDFQKYKVLLDYGHNTDSARALARLLPRLSPGRKIGLSHGTGNRTNEQLIDYGKALALVYDYIMLTDFDPRNRPLGETPKLVYEGLIRGGFSKENIEIIQDPEKAVDYIFSKVKKGDLLVIQPDELEPVMGQIMERYRQTITLPT
ncbi:cyanophycin synthetase [Desulfobacula toluolica]|uniref:Cyanophycin synthetase n=1 Tax=Desulfobacula toluolica (strain DSM 7467 / Tol2) TaxID=651182 RepID=K0NE85_DESTT|nr:cyanophycin synthetase [Desulfobacula toluolica]CCK79150.1 CphA: cyanophycin synthetase [Desulfobacula toluolica Tol2]